MGMWRAKVGEWVEVRSKGEILRTLDERGELEGLPFMPEMFTFCGGRFRVYKQAHKTCDTVFPTRGRRLDRTVHLETRCDGQAHDGCQAGCLIFWKEAWLRPVNGELGPAARATSGTGYPDRGNEATPRCSEGEVWARTRASDGNGDPVEYVCQATQVPYATRRLVWWDVRQYVRDYWSGNVGLWQILKGLTYATYYNISRAGVGVGPAMRWIYDRCCPVWGGTKFPWRSGPIPSGQPTPAAELDLQPGDVVRVRSHDEIVQTLNTETRNRGLAFDAEMVPYCGGTYRVLKRVTKLIDEKNGRMQQMRTPAVILDAVVCQGRYSSCRLFCPRSIYPLWREIWLERVRSRWSGQEADCDPLRAQCPRSDAEAGAESRRDGTDEGVA